MEEEVSRQTQIWGNESSQLAHTNPTPLYSISIWTNLSLFTLESDGRAGYMETYPKHDIYVILYYMTLLMNNLTNIVIDSG